MVLGFVVLSRLAALAFQQPESGKRLTVYTSQVGYSVTLLEVNGQPYVDVGELLQSLGDMRVEDNGNKWKARLNGQEMRFENGKERAKLRKQDLDLLGPFVVDSGRGLVPLASLPLLLNIMLNERVQMHESARRIFLGDVATHFSTELAKPGPGLTLTFTSPVNPVVTSEPGHTRLRFSREPLVSAFEKQPLDDKTITGVTYSESNGVADLTVASAAPLIANFGAGGKSITLVPAPAAAAAPSATEAPPATASVPSGQSPQPAPAPAEPAPAAPAAAAATRGRYLIVIDPAHGGDERGAALTDKLAEKDVTLSFARRLRTELANRNVAASLLRDSDATLSPDQRAEATNTSRPVLYVAIHAASNGTGVRVYSPLLPAEAAQPAAMGFTPWNRAQAPFSEKSSTWAAAMAAALQQKTVAAKAMAAALRPMNNVMAAAIAIELSPPAGKTVDPQALTGAVFQQNMAAAVAAALIEARKQVESASPQAGMAPPTDGGRR